MSKRIDLVYGKGDILTGWCGNAETQYLTMTHGRGDGTVFSPVEQCVTISFDSPAAIITLLHALLVNMVAFHRAGRGIPPEGAATQAAIKSMFSEIFSEGK